MTLFLASCQSRQVVQANVLGQTIPLLHKGKVGSVCAKATPTQQLTAQKWVKALPAPHPHVCLTQPAGISVSEVPSFYARLPLRDNAPPRYVLY